MINLLVQRKVTWAQIGFDPSTSAIVMKNKKKHRISPPEDSNFDLEQAEANLRRINENLLTTFISLNVTDRTLEDIRRQLSGERELDDDPMNNEAVSHVLAARILEQRVNRGGYPLCPVVFAPILANRSDVLLSLHLPREVSVSDATNQQHPCR